MTPSLSQESCLRLEAWRASLSPLTVDIVGDFAGKELFAIHGEALIAHCIPAAQVDYTYGFQLLHAVHAVESFLGKLRDRGCNFHLVWFDSHKDLCIPYNTRDEHGYKYILTRAILIQHFACSSASHISCRFDSVDCDAFRQYLTSNPQYFFMCSDGRATHSSRHPITLAHLSIGYHMSFSGYCVAFIDEINFTSSKVYISIATPAGKIGPLQQDQSGAHNDSTHTTPEKHCQLDQAICQRGDLTSRDIVTLQALSRVLEGQATGAKMKEAVCILVQLVLLRHSHLSQRSFIENEWKGKDSETMREFCEAATDIVDTGLGEIATAKWDLFDLVDGRLYLEACATVSKRRLPDALRSEFTDLAKSLAALSGVDVSDMLPGRLPGEVAKPPDRPSILVDQNRPSVLPFSHPVINQYLQQVQLETEEDSQLPYSQIFQELTHWHNAKKPIDPKHVPKPPGFFARRRNQRWMADTIAYSASLTGASGKNIDPEVIVSRKATEEKSAKAAGGSKTDWKLALKEQASSKNKKQTAKGGARTGKQKALDAAEATRKAKTEEKSLTVIESWRDRLAEFESERSLIKRFLKVEKHLSGLSSAVRPHVEAEIALYICHILTLLRRFGKFPKQTVPYIDSILWSKVIGMNGLTLTREIAFQLGLLSNNLGIPLDLGPLSALSKRELPFTMIDTELKRAAYPEPVNFQLEYCGPYMERSFDSAPDNRVPFHPDAWQRKVLDAIDADKSLFVVAPTSAGKTFISFYAMKKVLQANDDDVIVYVAPTKALVNQIAAEVQARFSKSYHNHEGRSVWAIHTRDYRVNNPQGCQVLVTVPHILQIMLLAPSNAKGPSSWARRVKRIIFDEVHCIGQAEDGVIWEQLLLLAPCPIIALSATVGNPLEFKEWLEGAQKVKGYNLDMIIHGSRYSDLRKYIYDSPSPSEFKGLEPVERLPFPGLEADAEVSRRFAFVHPVAALVGKNPDTLNDTSLEPRDCLTLWECMKECENDHYKLDKSLDPKHALPKLVKKSDIVRWEASLKKELSAWMVDPDSPFEAIQENLRGKRYIDLKLVHPLTERAVIVDGAKSSVHSKSIFTLALDLRACGALPAIFFNYDRLGCEALIATIFRILHSAEAKYRDNSPIWKKKIAEFEKWKKARSKTQGKAEKVLRSRKGEDGEGMSKLDVAREMGSQDESPWNSFDPDAPLPEFSFADTTKISKAELEERLDTLKDHKIRPHFIEALRRGLGVHHAGMNRQYRQVVEMLFRKGYLTIVVATGTLALGINMPCKTVVFTGDSVFLTALNYRQASGRAGRRGFDVLGNVVFHGIPPKRALEIMSARLPDLRGQFPTSVTLVLRLFGLLHGTNNSDYATRAVKSLLTQTRLYLGGPAAQMSIEHHLRFSIDYLRRQHLLSEDGTPLNFSGLVGHLYFTENAVFAFHSLLKEGYFHNLCSNISHAQGQEQNDVILEILLVLCHLFCRVPCYRYRDASWLANVVHRSPSLVLLPELPNTAVQVLRQHNQETLTIFHNYVSTYTSQHLNNTPDVQLPFTKHKVEPIEPHDMRDILPSLNKTEVRSPFAALSGFTDEFKTIGELCDTVRAGVFLEESAIPYIPIAPYETNGVPWNAYIYDFFKHGDMGALVRDNGIKGGDVWFHLKDFSLILATIVTSLANFLNPDAEVDDAAMIDIQDAGDIIEESEDANANEGKGNVETTADGIAKLQINKTTTRNKGKGKRVAVAESWDADTSDSETDAEDNFRRSATSSNRKTKLSSYASSSTGPTTPSWSQDDGKSLSNVYKAFKMLQEQFNEKFMKVWA
ncbi:P-loop containing nucleoside triphosphate hydrolase protein [Hypoxylon sp. FL0890]|nr:P-loop containing nucleoside triphosphate hydrolase protein [Hypoxylon sp. FL0890]